MKTFIIFCPLPLIIMSVMCVNPVTVEDILHDSLPSTHTHCSVNSKQHSSQWEVLCRAASRDVARRRTIKKHFKSHGKPKHCLVVTRLLRCEHLNSLVTTEQYCD